MAMASIWWVVCLSGVVIARDVFPSHKNDLSWLPDPRWGISVGCIDFSLMPEGYACAL
jgi:hypothetical protein